MVIRQGSSPLVGVPAAKSTPGRAELTVVRPAVEPQEQVLGRSKWERRYTSNLRITDTVVVCSAVLLAQYVRFGSTPAADDGDEPLPDGVLGTVLVVIWLSALAGFRTRSPKYIGAGIEEYRRVVAASFWTFGAVAMAELLLKLELSRVYLAVALPVGNALPGPESLEVARLRRRQRAAGRYQTAVLAIGDTEAVTNLASELTGDP